MRLLRVFAALAVVTLVGMRVGWALMSVGEGNEPVGEGNWPEGTREVANLPTRIVHWDGPLASGENFGFRGNTGEFQKALEAFARIRGTELQLLVREGRSQLSFMSGADKHVDWNLEVWDPRTWFQISDGGFLRDYVKNPSPQIVPPPLLTVNVAGPGEEGIDWSKVKVPAGIKVIDERATSAGYKREDGSVIRGDVYDMIKMRPLVKARVKVERRVDAKEEVWKEMETDAAGHFEFKGVPEGQTRVTVMGPAVVEAPAPGRLVTAPYAARAWGSGQMGKNTLREGTIYLAPARAITGMLRDEAGKPLAGVRVRAEEQTAIDASRYSPAEGAAEVVTGAAGEFRLVLAEGKTRLWATKEGLYQAESMRALKVPSEGMVIVMTGTGTVRGRVLKNGVPDKSANVNINAVIPAGGTVIGTWGGSSGVKEDGTFDFKNVPPGEYVISSEFSLPGKENPDGRRIKVEAGKVLDVELSKGVAQRLPGFHKGQVPRLPSIGDVLKSC